MTQYINIIFFKKKLGIKRGSGTVSTKGSMFFMGKIIHQWWDFPAIPAGIVPYLSSGPPSGGVSLSLAKREASCG